LRGLPSDWEGRGERPGIADVEWRADLPLANWHHSLNPASVNAKPNRAKEMYPLLFSKVLASLLNMTEETDSQKHSILSDYSKALLDQLTGEYRIIQDKIDKIADFGSRFEAGP
jgi:hypothetical protein